MDILPNVTMKIQLKSDKPAKQDNWYCFEWEVTLVKDKKSYTFPYSTGIGLLDMNKPKFSKFDKFSTIEINPDRDGIKGTSIHVNQLEQMNLKYRHKWDYLLFQPKVPTKHEVLQSLAMDCANMLDIPKFEEWCSDFGYDNDSIKAKKIFDACYEQTANMKSLLGTIEFNTFVTTDYDHIEESSSAEPMNP